MGALYFGVGKALGGLVGGLAIDQIGDRMTFRLVMSSCLNSIRFWYTEHSFRYRKSKQERFILFCD
jgi:hypothetical protein